MTLMAQCCIHEQKTLSIHCLVLVQHGKTLTRLKNYLGFIARKEYIGPGRVAQSVTCLVTDAKLTADPGVASSIPARSHTFVEIDHEIISTSFSSLPLKHS